MTSMNGFDFKIIHMLFMECQICPDEFRKPMEFDIYPNIKASVKKLNHNQIYMQR